VNLIDEGRTAGLGLGLAVTVTWITVHRVVQGG
jgi:hypothetical protein